jgi:hypothetical protein
VAGVFEDEAHFILKCKVNQNMRESRFNNIELDNEIFLKEKPACRAMQIFPC